MPKSHIMVIFNGDGPSNESGVGKGAQGTQETG